ncbi:MAG: hypothetical protein SFW36_04055 [Leptolyngbyaceae cyanobacterium bins.59]|nr:hypothetical protein [Leptolyngbyaceae cyanobacterium bins.59]
MSLSMAEQNSTDQAVLNALKQRERTLGELSDLTQLPYDTLQSVLKSLKYRDLVESGFREEGSLSVLIYRLRPAPILGGLFGGK